MDPQDHHPEAPTFHREGDAEQAEQHAYEDLGVEEVWCPGSRVLAD